MESIKTQISKDVQSWPDANKIIMEKISGLVCEYSGCGSFEIMSFTYLETVLVLRYLACFRIFRFNYYDNETTEPNTIEMETYYTKTFNDDELLSHVKDFQDRFDKLKNE